MISLRTLGRLEVTSHDRIVGLPKKAAALLAIVADAESRGVPRQELAALLWPAAHDAEQSINQAVHVIWKSLGRSVINADDGRITINGALLYDYSTVLKLIREGKAIEAASLVGGDFLPALSITEGDAFDEWRNRKQLYLFERLRSVLFKALEEARSQSDWAAINEVAIQGMRLLPDTIDFQIAGIEYLISQGSMSEARERYAGLAVFERPNVPSFESLLAAPATVEAHRPRTFVGRDEELRLLEARLSAPPAEQQAIVMIKGHPGIGKSTLVEEALAAAARTGGWSITVKARHAEQGIAYNILAEVVRRISRRVASETLPPVLAGALMEVVPEFESIASKSSPQLSRDAAKLRLFEAATRLVLEAGTDRRFILFIDDIQWADEASLEWLLFLSRRCEGSNSSIVIATRLSPVRQMIGELETMEGALVIDLQPLSPAAVAKLVKTYIGTAAENDVASTVFEATRGNPLLALEYIRNVSSGRVSKEDLGLPFLRRELGRLSAEARAIIEASSVLGHGQRNLVLRIAGVPADTLQTRWTELSQFLDDSDRDTLDIHHDLVAESVYALIPGVRKRALHLAAADALLDAKADAGMVAEHYRQGGNNILAVRYAVEAAAKRERARAYHEAAQFLELAVEASAPSDKIELTGRLADALFRSADYRRAAPLLLQLSRQDGIDPKTALDWKWRYVRAARAGKLLPDEEIVRLTEELLTEADRVGNVS